MSNQVGNLLFNLETVLAVVAAVGVAAGVMWRLLRKAPAAAAGPDTLDKVVAPGPAAPSKTAMHGPARSTPAKATQPTVLAAAGREDGDFVTSALMANATNSTTIGYLVGGSLAGALLGDVLHPDKPDTALADDSSRRSSDGGWIDTGTSCAFESSGTDSGGGSSSND